MLRWAVHLEGGPRRVNHAAVAVGHKVYSFGGYCSGEDYETLRQIDVHIFNAVSFRWTKLPPYGSDRRDHSPQVPYMRYGHTAVLLDDTIYVWGGRNDTEGACNVLYAFDVNTHNWSTPKVHGSIPGARDGHSACALGKCLFIFGGYEQLVGGNAPGRSGEIETSEEDGEGGSRGSEDSETVLHWLMVRGPAIQEELSTLSFEQLQELLRQSGLKVYNQVAYGPRKGDVTPKGNGPHKNRPIEMSTKQPVPYLRKVVPVQKRMVRDPRFDDLSGEFKPDIYEKTYSFLSDVRNKEKKVIKKKLGKVKNAKQKEKLECLLQRMTQQDEVEKKNQQQRERMMKFKQSQRAKVQQGSKPYFLKKSDQRKLELTEKYLDLKKRGKVERFLASRRKRNATKDRRNLPGKKSH
ncbi:ribosomal RNA processing protein 36 homolog [Scyliorhinus canicula]|uniref:ribosomal RNA processing protein 36 homolog n=1 Tax=Scyliorhinus canicula TaxID=7830 RepID=UPI0018F58FC3|nr:ribosomal RNA processing protein 36 homolog [Scyliorhinus canicula]